MVCAESDLLQLKSAQETSLVPTSTCCSVPGDSKGQAHRSHWFPCKEGRSMEMHMVLRAVLKLSAYDTPHVYAGVFGGSWVFLGEPERAVWTKTGRSGHRLPGKVSMAAGWPLASRWHARGTAGTGSVTPHYLIHSIREKKLHSREVLPPRSMSMIFYLGTSSGRTSYCGRCPALIWAGAGGETGSSPPVYAVCNGKTPSWKYSLEEEQKAMQCQPP